MRYLGTYPVSSPEDCFAWFLNDSFFPTKTTSHAFLELCCCVQSLWWLYNAKIPEEKWCGCLCSFLSVCVVFSMSRYTFGWWFNSLWKKKGQFLEEVQWFFGLKYVQEGFLSYSIWSFRWNLFTGKPDFSAKFV